MSSTSHDPTTHDSPEGNTEADIPRQGVAAAPRRLRVTQRDIDVYAALVGVPQSLVVQDAGGVAGDGGSVAGTARASAASRAWSATVRVAGPELSAWVRRLSRDAKQQLRQAKARLAAGGRKTRA
jgi:hypothetical protein